MPSGRWCHVLSSGILLRRKLRAGLAGVSAETPDVDRTPWRLRRRGSCAAPHAIGREALRIQATTAVAGLGASGTPKHRARRRTVRIARPKSLRPAVLGSLVTVPVHGPSARALKTHESLPVVAEGWQGSRRSALICRNRFRHPASTVPPVYSVVASARGIGPGCREQQALEAFPNWMFP
jgi:hypothetical protein